MSLITSPSLDVHFARLIAAYPTWAALSSHLTSSEGGRLHVQDNTNDTEAYALIRYVKGKSNFDVPHTAAFRSVIWDTRAHRPVSITPYKSAAGESTPPSATTAGYVIEPFVDGVMIGAFYDTYNHAWRLHTRSTLDAGCRYFSQSKTFAQMFEEACPQATSEGWDKTRCYTFVLQHPENRIVCPVGKPSATMVQNLHIAFAEDMSTSQFSRTFMNSETFVVAAVWPEVRMFMDMLNRSKGAKVQGIMIRDAHGNRWKLRSAEYNRIRHLRGNSPRLDFHYLNLWRSNLLDEYLRQFPEEKFAAKVVQDKWKTITNAVYHTYVDVFKARSLAKSAIAPKLRPFIYGLHNLYMTELKPAGRSVDWKTTVKYMNDRDTPQMLYAINWEVRAAAAKSPIPLEPASVLGTQVTETESPVTEAPKSSSETVADSM
jgi:hypothetical protein